MFKPISLIVILVFSLSAKDIFDNSFDYFFKPRPIIIKPIDTSLNYSTKLSLKLINPQLSLKVNEPAIWEFKPIVQIPAFKINQSSIPNTKLDISLFNSVGGGITYQRSIVKDSSNYSTLSFSLIALLSSQSITTGPIDFSLAITIGGFDNKLQTGIGYDFGTYIGRSRFFWLLDYGINVTQNKKDNL